MTRDCSECDFCNIHDGTFHSEEVSSDGTYFECCHPDLPPNPDPKDGQYARSCDEWMSLLETCPIKEGSQ